MWLVFSVFFASCAHSSGDHAHEGEDGETAKDQGDTTPRMSPLQRTQLSYVEDEAFMNQ